MGDKSNIELQEYKEKWAYIRHTEILQDKQMQWFFVLVGVVLTFIYSTDNAKLLKAVGKQYIPILLLVGYSSVFSFQMLRIKKNYKIYNERIMEIEGQPMTNKTWWQHLITIFMFRYYIVIIIGAFLAKMVAIELKVPEIYSWVVFLAYIFVEIALAFWILNFYEKDTEKN